MVPNIRISGDPAAQYVQMRPLDRDVSSAASLQKARHWWVQECHARHGDQCNNLGPSILPTRVVEVGHPGDAPTLYISDLQKPRIEQYVALSYCWGGPQSATLCHRTLHDWSSGKPLTDLPKTIQDAITVTRALGIRYLWVDSLCIVQDDIEDRTREIGKMCEIYERAYVTISAASARSSQDGILYKRDIPQSCQPVYKVRLRCPDGRLGVISFVQLDWEYSPTDEPIHQRAWTLQEAVLSPRMLIFDSRQLRWVCRSVKDSNGWYDWGSGASLRLIKFGKDPWEPTGSMTSWRDIVESYTSRALSVSGDKLPAIAGVAQRYGDLTQYKYLAGLWEEHLVSDLLWEKHETKNKDLIDTWDHRPRPLQYRAPSWSWASIDGAVEWRATYWNRYFDREHIVIDVLDCSTHLVTQAAPYSSVNGGHITIQGRLAPVFLTEGGSCLSLPPASGGGRIPGTIRDAAEHIPEIAQEMCEPPRSPVLCLEVVVRPSNSDYKDMPIEFYLIVGLLLVPAATNYSRVGLLWAEIRLEPRLASDCPYDRWREHFDQHSQTITII